MLFRSDRKSTRLNSSHTIISYAVFCLKKKKNTLESREMAHDVPRLLCVHERAHCTLMLLLRSGLGGTLPPLPSVFSVFFFFLMIRRPPRSTLFPSPPLFR